MHSELTNIVAVRKNRAITCTTNGCALATLRLRLIEHARQMSTVRATQRHRRQTQLDCSYVAQSRAFRRAQRGSAEPHGRSCHSLGAGVLPASASVAAPGAEPYVISSGLPILVFFVAHWLLSVF